MPSDASQPSLNQLNPGELSLSRGLARQIIEVLGSSGTPPTKGVQHFNVGNRSLLDALDRFYLSSYLQDGGAAFKLVVGDYGSGKSHFLYCLRDVAWARGFAVAKVDLSPVETPYNDQKIGVRRGGAQPHLARSGRGRQRRAGFAALFGRNAWSA